MTPELNIENSICEYLQMKMPGVKVDVLAQDIALLVMEAKRNPNGLIVVSHSNQPAVYNAPYPAPPSAFMAESYVITILSNNRRDKDGVYEYLNMVRDYLSEYAYVNSRPYPIRHLISTQKFPDYEDGVYIAEYEIEFKLKYPFYSTY